MFKMQTRFRCGKYQLPVNKPAMQDLKFNT
jgi:hypothetical protein